MKKLLMPLVVGLCACTSEYSDMQSVNGDAKTVTVSVIDMNVDSPESRWVYDESNKFGWKSDDVLGIFPVGKGSQLEFPIEINEGETKETAEFNGGGWAFKGGYSYAAYSPYNLLSTRGNKIPFSYANQCRKMDGNSFDLRENMLKVAAPSTVENAKISFAFGNIEAFLRIELYDLPADKNYKSLTLYANGEVIPQNKEYDIFSMKVNGTTITIDDKVLDVDNHLKIDLMDAKPVGDMLLVWMAFPAIGTNYGSLKAVVKDSEGYVYVGDVVNKDKTPFDKELKRNSRTTVRAYLKETDGFQAVLGDWIIDGQNYSGEAI